MAYKQQPSGEYLIGYIPSRDGSDYDPNKPGVAYSELIDLLARERFGLKEDFLILIAGRTGSTGLGQTGGPLITAPSFVTRRGQVLNALSEQLDTLKGKGKWKSQDAITYAIDPNSAPDLLQKLLSLKVTPIHITGIVVRRIIQE